MNYTREELIKAMIEYNKSFLSNPENFSIKYSDDENFAVAQVDFLLSKIPEKDSSLVQKST